MSLQFFNTDRQPKTGRKKYIKPLEVLSDPYLTPVQKHIVLEAMLAEAREQAEESGGRHARQNIRVEEDIIKAQLKVKQEMD